MYTVHLSFVYMYTGLVLYSTVPSFVTGWENQCSLHLTLGTEVQYAWLHEQCYTSHVCGWKLSDITFDWLVFCSGLNFSKWSQQLCICKYLISVMYLCHYLWIMCVYSKCVSKWSMQWTCDNSVMSYWPSLGWGTLHCVLCRQMFCFTCRESQCCAVYSLASWNIWLWSND